MQESTIFKKKQRTTKELQWTIKLINTDLYCLNMWPRKLLTAFSWSGWWWTQSLSQYHWFVRHWLYTPQTGWKSIAGHHTLTTGAILSHLFTYLHVFEQWIPEEKTLIQKGSQTDRIKPKILELNPWNLNKYISINIHIQQYYMKTYYLIKEGFPQANVEYLSFL